MKFEYSVNIVWSKEDEAYLAFIPELPGCIADGPTPEEALKEIRVVAEEWVDVAGQEGRKVPSPRSFEDCEKQFKKFQEDVQKHIHTAISKIVETVVPELVGNAIQEILPRILEREEKAWSCFSGPRGSLYLNLPGTRFPVGSEKHRVD